MAGCIERLGQQVEIAAERARLTARELQAPWQ